MNKIISFLKGIFKKDVQSIGIQREVRTLQLEKLLEMKKALDTSEWTDDEFKSKFIEEMNKNILKHQNGIHALEKRLSRDEKRELKNWHFTVKSFIFK